MVSDECTMLGLQAIAIEHIGQVEALRQIRNACKDGFAHDNTQISELAQRAWWVAHKDRVKGWLYATPDYVLVGYGILRQTDDGRWWSSVAVLPAHAGSGYGGAITGDLIRRIDVPVWASARVDNPAAQRLHRKSDWEELGRDDKLVHYRTLPHVYDAVLSDWAKNGVVLT